jgi:Ser/Thr protein kinase RdoA (MazF antagonist)
VSIEDDASLQQAMAYFRVGADALLGIGSEACVFALGAHQIVRIHHEGTTPEDIATRASLLDELHLSASAVPFAIPKVSSSLELAGRLITIEPRLPGQPLSRVLESSTGSARERLLISFLDCSRQLQRLRVERPWYGDLCQADPVRASSFRSYLEARARKSLEQADPAFARIDAAALAAGLPEPIQPSFVHVDLYPGNVLVEGDAVSAVVDFGGLPIVGDARLEPLSAVSYLTPFITRAATARDQSLAREWLVDQGIAEELAAAERWLAARWSFARNDAQLQRWCRVVLLGEPMALASS